MKLFTSLLIVLAACSSGKGGKKDPPPGGGPNGKNNSLPTKKLNLSKADEEARLARIAQLEGQSDLTTADKDELNTLRRKRSALEADLQAQLSAGKNLSELDLRIYKYLKDYNETPSKARQRALEELDELGMLSDEQRSMLDKLQRENKSESPLPPPGDLPPQHKQ